MRLSQTQVKAQFSRIQSLLTSSPTGLRLARVASAGLLAISMTGLVGCKSMPFELPKPSMPKLAMPKLAKPDMSKMAFWKSENLMPKKGNLPKPPSLSFDPTPVERSIASAEQATRSRIDSVRNEIADAKEQLAKPLRKPYAVASQTKLPNLDLQGGQVAKAQRDFQAALASSSKAVEKSIGHKVADLKTAGNDFQFGGSFKKAKASVDDSLAAVNRSLYDSKGQLASSAKAVADKASSSFGESAATNQLSMFEQRLKDAAEKAKAAPAAIAQSATATASNAFAGLSASKTPAKPNDLAASAAVSSEVAELKAQLAELRAEQQKLIQQGQQQLAAKSIAKPVAQDLVAPKATEFVAQLSAQPVVSNRAFTAPAAAAPPIAKASPVAMAPPSYPQMYPSSAPIRTASASNHVLSPAPQNVLRGNFSPILNGGAATQQATGSQQHGSSQYPATPHGGYAPRTGYSATVAPTRAPSTSASQVSFQENGDSNLVISATTPVEPATIYVSEVNIPEAVLRGASNYAPGSVHPLRR